MRLLGDKLSSRRVFSAAGFPTMPASGLVTNEQELSTAAREIGYPLLVKVPSGAAGRGIFIVNREEDLTKAFNDAMADATRMGTSHNPGVYIERCLEGARHLEVQIIGDKHGNYAHVGTRESSIQRRRQKVIEEAPFVSLDSRVREEACRKAIEVVKGIGYSGLGTIECLVDTKGNYYFLEMNVRVQVEHTVTEMVTGVDLVREQVRVAAGERLSFGPDTGITRGHAIELRIYAEDPQTFVPSNGEVREIRLPSGPGVRLDPWLKIGQVVKAHVGGNSAILLKLIVHASDRSAAVQRARRCLDELVIDGVGTNIPLLKRMTSHPDFESGNVSTSWMESHFAPGSSSE